MYSALSSRGAMDPAMARATPCFNAWIILNAPDVWRSSPPLVYFAFVSSSLSAS